MHHTYLNTLRPFAAALALFTAAGAACADVTITSAFVDGYANGFAGNQGSAESGTDDPPAAGQNAGLTILHAYSGAGPVPAGPLTSTPGTFGEVRCNAFAIESIFPPYLHPSGYTVDIWLTATDHFEYLDGGIYSGGAQGSFNIAFTCSVPTPYTLTGECDFDDENFLGYTQLTGGGGLLFFAPGPGGGLPGPRPVSYTGVLDAGPHTFQGDVTVGENSPAHSPFFERGKQRLHLVLGTVSGPCGPADIGKQGGIGGPDGLLDNNDFVIFIDYFFNQNPVADFGKQGGTPGTDDLFDNNDFIVFIDAFFNGCTP